MAWLQRWRQGLAPGTPNDQGCQPLAFGGLPGEPLRRHSSIVRMIDVKKVVLAERGKLDTRSPKPRIGGVARGSDPHQDRRTKMLRGEIASHLFRAMACSSGHQTHAGLHQDRLV